MQPQSRMSAALARPEIVTLPDPHALAAEAARRFVALAAEAIAQRGRFTVALAGGSTPAELYRLLAQTPWREQVDWPRTLIFFGDERCAPPDHAWSNYRMAAATLLDHVPLPPGNICRMAGERPPADAARDYAAALRRAFGLAGSARPRFDLVLLGLGDDGHTASLFPGTAALAERRRLVVANDPPGYVQPAVSRITLTFPALNAARAVMFLVAGAGKAEKVQAILGAAESGHPERNTGRFDAGVESKDLPAGQVRPRQGRLIWLLDRAAASELTRK